MKSLLVRRQATIVPGAPDHNDLQPQDLSVTSLKESAGDSTIGRTGDALLPAICIASSDSVWATLLTQNLAARGASATQCGLSALQLQIPSMADGSWVVVDGGWPMIELQSAIKDLNTQIRENQVRSIVVVDELVGGHPLSSFEPDHVVKRTADMRVLVRELLGIFASSPPDQQESVR